MNAPEFPLRRDFPLVRRHVQACLGMNVFDGNDAAEESRFRVQTPYSA